MSSVKTAPHLPPRHAIDPEPADLPWWQVLLGGVVLVAVLYLAAKYGMAALLVIVGTR